MSFIQRYGRCIYALITPEPTNYLVELTISPSELGTISGGGTYEKGASVTITATPNTGYIFEGWYDGNILVSSETEYTFTINDSLNLSAVFILDPYNGHEYVEIGGLKWATMNVGATKVTDYGLYFAWGDTQGYTAEQVGSGEGQKYFGWADYKYGNGTSSPGVTGMTKYNSTDGKTVLDLSDDAVIANWGGQWRMPTEADFNTLSAATTNAWVTDYQGSGVAGRLFTDKTDSTKVLFFPAAGSCISGSVYNVGSNGSYWSSSLSASNVIRGRSLSFNSGNCNMGYGDRCRGYSVRGVIG